VVGSVALAVALLDHRVIVDRHTSTDNR